MARTVGCTTPANELEKQNRQALAPVNLANTAGKATERMIMVTTDRRRKQHSNEGPFSSAERNVVYLKTTGRQ